MQQLSMFKTYVIARQDKPDDPESVTLYYSGISGGPYPMRCFREKVKHAKCYNNKEDAVVQLNEWCDINPRFNYRVMEL